MIELVTGLPGNGKTLYTLSMVKARAEAENRPVYYHGIPELTLNWEKLEDPTKWASCPPGAMIVLDEAQKTFRNRSLGAQPPQHVTDLETHRHLGIDLVMITQHPSLIDPSVRRLAGRHQHLVRAWGMEASTVHKWDAVKDNCDKSRADSDKKRWAFDKKAYAYYKSAELHTVKRSIPGRVKLLAVLFVILIAVVWFVVSFFKAKVSGDPAAAARGSAPGAVAAAAASPIAGQPGVPVDPVAELRDYVYARTERVAGLPHTAPRYDELTAAVRAPVPAMCVQVGDVRSRRKIDCKCYTQQGTAMQVEFNMCIEFARNGWFQDFNPEAESQSMDRMAQGQAVMSHRGDVSQGPIGSQVAAFQHPPDVSRIQGRAVN